MSYDTLDVVRRFFLGHKSDERGIYFSKEEKKKRQKEVAEHSNTYQRRGLGFATDETARTDL